MIRAIRIHEPGGPDAMTLEDCDLPDPGPTECRIRHEAIGVNFIDVYHRTGLYPLPLPSGLGVEACGIVEAIGARVSSVKPGDRVAYATGGVGAYAEARLAAEATLVRVPASLDSRIVAASLLKGMTVEFLVRRCFPVKKGQIVLFHAAAGGVGSIACQWLSAMGAIVIGTVGRAEKVALAKANGCAHVIVLGKDMPVLAKTVRELTRGDGVPVVYDSIGKDTVEASLDCLSPRGMLVSFGNASGKPPPIDLLSLSRRGSLFVTRPTLFTYVQERSDLEACAAALFEELASGRVKVSVTNTFPLASAPDAHRALESRSTTGSTVLLP